MAFSFSNFFFENSLWLGLALSYLLGSIPTAVWISKVFYGKDIREFGSKNAGSTNMYRVLGWKAGLATQLIDIAKGFVAALLPYYFAAIRGKCIGNYFESEEFILFQLIYGFAAVLGHVYTVFAGFKGGKGVNTALGMVLAINPIGSGVAVVVFVVVLLTSKMVSLGSILATASFPIFLSIQYFILNQPIVWSLYIFSFLLPLLVIYTHRENLKRILAGTESKVNLFSKKQS